MGEMGEIKPDDAVNDRASPRTNLLLSASAEVDGRDVPVRIRNLSETGALIEGGGLPEAGAKLVIKRAELAVPATVAWASAGKRGVRFDGPTPVSEWTGGKPRPLDCTGLRDQRRVDAILTEARAEAAGPPLRGRASLQAQPPAACPNLDASLADELGYVQRLLEDLGDSLIADLFLVQRHGKALQSLDLVGQILGHVAAILRAEDKGATVDSIGMEDLRARLKRKPIG